MNTSNTTTGALAQAVVHNVTAVIKAAVNATAAVAATAAPVLTSAAAVVDTTATMPNLSTGINATVAATIATSPGINNTSILVVPAEPSLFAGFNLTNVWCDCVHIEGESLGSGSIVFDSMDLTLPLWLVFCTCVYIYACAFHRNDDGDVFNKSTAVTGWRRKKSARKNKKKMRSLSKNMRFRQHINRDINMFPNTQYIREAGNLKEIHAAVLAQAEAARFNTKEYEAYHYMGGLHNAASKLKEA